MTAGYTRPVGSFFAGGVGLSSGFCWICNAFALLSLIFVGLVVRREIVKSKTYSSYISFQEKPCGRRGNSTKESFMIREEEQLDVDTLNHFRSLIEGAFMETLHRFPSTDEQHMYLRLLANGEMERQDIVLQLKQSREYRKEQRNEIVDPLPPASSSMVLSLSREMNDDDGPDYQEGREEEEEEEEREGAEEKAQNEREDGEEGSVQRDDEGEASDRKEVDFDFKWTDFDSRWDENKMRRSDAVPELQLRLDELSALEKSKMYDAIKSVYTKVYEEETAGGPLSSVALEAMPMWKPDHLSQQTLDMWAEILWRENGDLHMLEDHMRRLRRASTGFPGDNKRIPTRLEEARIPPGMDPGPYAYAYMLDVDPLGDVATKEEKDERRKRFLQERRNSYGVGTKWDDSVTVERALFERSRRTGMAELSLQRERDIAELYSAH